MSKKKGKSAPMWDATAKAKNPYYWVSAKVGEAQFHVDSDRTIAKLLEEVELACFGDNDEFECLP